MTTKAVETGALPPAGGAASRFVGVTLDAVDVETVGSFWAAALRGRMVETGPDRWRVDTSRRDAVTEMIWINAVERPRAGKTRVHIDVRLGCETPVALLRAGARVLRSPGVDPWYVLADPEGNAFCAYPSGPDRTVGMFELVVDSRDAHAQAYWWAALLGGRVEEEGDAAAVTGTNAIPWDYLVFERVPEPKCGRNRMRWHVELSHTDTARLVTAGAILLGESGAGPDRVWELADPEGNEFCAHPADRFTAAAGEPR
ncbi:VOC family protein [Dactylosporangium sp. NPDC051541]|uniref:VOC family protein n=1 Tax=Dactylosporangium sp. NPDC051541 TaxID=3363977 RepID=UPI0037B6DEB5